MQWLLTSHVRRYHQHYGGSGHVWQGRFKSFPVQRDEHLITVLRYVLQNPVRACCRVHHGNGSGLVCEGRRLWTRGPLETSVSGWSN